MPRTRGWVLMAVLTWTAMAAADDAGVDAMLQGHDTTPSAAAWRALGPEAAVRLRALADDPGALPSTRVRAVAALAHFPETTTRRFLADLLADADAPGALRWRAAATLARAFGDDAVAELAASLEDADPRLQAEVIRALERLGTARAIAALAHARGTVRR